MPHKTPEENRPKYSKFISYNSNKSTN